jgi:hypothetical protein
MIDMFDILFDDTISGIKKWKPKEKYSDENKYRDDLLDYLRKELNKKDNFSFLNQEHVSVRKETGRSVSDISINRNQVGIELKKDLRKKRQIDTLIGQLDEYKRDFKDIIVVLVGDTNREAFEYCKDRISYMNKNTEFILNQEPRIKLIDKGSKSKTKKSKGKFDSVFPDSNK